MSKVLMIPGLGEVEITNWDEFERGFLFKVGELTVNAIQEQIIAMRLFDKGEFIRSIEARVRGDTLTIESSDPKSVYLEYGTLAFGAQYTEESFPKRPYPKKKDISRAAALRFPKGMQPFAPFRRVIYSETKMASIITRAGKPGLPTPPPVTAFGIKARDLTRKVKKVRNRVRRAARPAKKVVWAGRKALRTARRLGVR